jgi:hypothetical protein
MSVVTLPRGLPLMLERVGSQTADCEASTVAPSRSGTREKILRCPQVWAATCEAVFALLPLFQTVHRLFVLSTCLCWPARLLGSVGYLAFFPACYIRKLEQWNAGDVTRMMLPHA